MPKEHLPIYQIQDFKAWEQKEHYLYFSSLKNHLQEHQFIREPHKHSFFIILLITHGSGTHTIDFQTYEVKPNVAFFMIPGQVHSWELSQEADGFVIFFTPEFYLKQFPHRKLYSFPFFNALLHKPILLLSQKELDKALETIQNFQQEYTGSTFMRNEMLCCFLEMLLIYLARIYKKQQKEVQVQAGEPTLLQKFENLVEQHFKEHLPVSFYADKLHITAKQLGEVIKATVGKTTTGLIQERSILEAQRLLVHSDLTSTQIATDLGYFDTTYFFRFFKKHTGLTPEQFRSTHK
ncbi:AraC family transcriptional regulator [Adhaeribacter aquaticus]|uniref:AraC family transcriptional regulator n=1 Tax=Adhaeribacter aquaticus TaxID=299567 RepID=UPI00041BF21A|nr:helix-turn-helix domain-containing protein [Adhaeribacter aquaticus]